MDQTLLTERQLLRMPRASYMNTEQLDFFRARLGRLRAETQDRVEDTKQSIASKQPEADELDRAATEEENRQRLRLAERHYYLLRKIDAALDRIESNRYGYCAVTGDPIGLERLLLRPTAELSIEEKTRQEQRERNYVKQRS